jgi:hypothetical protein
VAAVTACNAQVATLGPTTALQSGSSKTCTAAGCLFGAPVAVPDTTPPTSLCLVNRISGSIAGTLACNTGALSLSLPVDSVAYMTGDTATDPTNTIPGIQPCPICSAGTCIGGTNNGMACVPANLVGSFSYPTSADCPPDPMYAIGTMAIGFALSTGTVTWTGTVATNDTGSTASIQNRVFSGYCRDAEVTGVFQSPHKHCWQNGMAVGSACTQPFETCEQSNNGAFGPNGGANRTITAVGAAFSGILSSPTAGTLVSLFSIPPTFEAWTDTAIDIPGPGAVAIPMTARMCATVAGCP